MKIGATPLEFIELGKAIYLVLALNVPFQAHFSYWAEFPVHICVNFKVFEYEIV